ncbi:A24 family peptidase [Actinomycetes bacterium KLBMP 9797]
MGGAALVGAVLGPAIRAQIFRHGVPADQAWRRDCSECGAAAGGLLLAPSGRCPRCRCRVGPRPGVVEAVAAVVFAFLAWRMPEPLPLLALCWVAAFGVVLAFVDVAVHRLPDRLTLPAFGGGAILFGLSAAVDGDFRRYAVAVACAVILAAGYLVLVLISPGGMGLGDAKAALSVGLVAGWFGWSAAATAAVAGFLLAGGYAVALLALRKVGRKDHIPHGPFLLLGALTALALSSP